MTSGGLSTAYHVVLSLVVVIAVVVVAAKLARRAGIKGPGAGLRVLDRAGLSREASVAVVEIEGRRLVVGVTPHGVNLLTDLGAAPAPSTGSQPSGVSQPTTGPELIELPGDHAPVADHAHVADHADVADQAPAPRTPATSALPKPRLAQGSVLAPSTWKQGVEALRELTARKG